MDRTTGYWWSPDDKRIAYTRVDDSPVTEIDRFDIYADSLKVVKQRYPAAGTKNAIVRLFVKSVGGDPASEIPAVQVDLVNYPDNKHARDKKQTHGSSGLADGGSLAVQRQSRDQK